MNQWMRLRRFSIAMVGLSTLILAAAAGASTYLEMPGVIILMFGFAAGFATGGLLGMLFVQAAINNLFAVTQRPSTLDDIVRSRRRL